MNITKSNILLGIIVVIVIWFLTGLITYFSFENKGEIGDMFGSVNALFSGLALFGIIISILIQQKELNLQRTELTETRIEFKTNRLTNILFKQIEYMNRIIESAKFGDGTVDISKLVDYLEKHKRRGEIQRVTDIMTQNSRQITKLITEVLPIMKNFEEILNMSGLEKSELLQIKRTYFNNTNPHFLDLLLFEINSLKLPESDDKEVQEFDMSILKMKISRAEYIINYGKDVE